MAFAALDCDMKRSLFSIAESCDIAGDFQESFCSILSEKKILRRRTHGAFPLEYREPLSSAVQIRRETTDEQNAVCGRSKPTSYADEEDLSVCDENQGGAYGPLVETASSLINQLQLASSSEEFVGKKRPLVVAKSRNGIIFTGFPKEWVLQADPTLQATRQRRGYSSPTTYRSAERVRRERNRVLAPHCDKLSSTLSAKYNMCLKNREQLRLLFSEMGKIFVCDDCSPPTDDLKWIIKECGGEITTDPCECSLVVAPRNHSLEISCSEEVDCPPPVVVEKYILDCVSENMVLTLDDYMEHDVVDDLC
ncbi:unnamed protein product [Heligmosomoides polygyrus]|uniref:BRCT domain-containing protein n=1 Tax=Heligmosomoides polygyrus TaxID=6339 RepID=A0A3P8C796_HELPZ|nr:unnamed protein product [Heligmosomoides polygyrus]